MSSFTNVGVKLFLLDEHPMSRGGLRESIRQQTTFTLVGEADTGASGLKGAKESMPDLIIMDVNLSDMDGIELVTEILKILPGIKIVVYSENVSRASVDLALRAGVRGYLSKRSTWQKLLEAIKAVMNGDVSLSPEVEASVLETYHASLMVGSLPKASLSERDKKVLRLVTKGRRNKEIAGELAVSIKSVEAYRSRLMKKLVCSNSIELVRYAIREGIGEL